jgi:integrase
MTRLIRHDGPATAARAERRRLMAERRSSAPITTQPDNPTFRDLATRYLATRHHVLAPNTIANIATDYRLRIDPVLGASDVRAISRESVEMFIARLVRESTSRRMVVGTVASLRAILAAAVDWGYIPSNPAARLRLPAPEHHEVQAVERVLDRDELVRLIRACATLRIETLVRVGAEAGLRRGEVIGLRWDDVDLPARRLTVRRNIVQVRAAHRLERTTKGRRSRRVAISTGLAGRLGDWFAESVGGGGASATGPVWPGRGGRQFRNRAVAEHNAVLQR